MRAPMRLQDCSAKRPVAGCRVPADGGRLATRGGGRIQKRHNDEQRDGGTRSGRGKSNQKKWGQRRVMCCMSQQQRKRDRLEGSS